MTATSSYRDLIVWQKSIQLVVELYKITKEFPREEIYGLTSQMRRSAVSIPSNIAEGRNRGTKKDYTQFLRIAYGSGAELETQITICKQIEDTKSLNLSEVMKMLNVMIQKLTA
jgi:four helix bundle protein